MRECPNYKKDGGNMGNRYKCSSNAPLDRDASIGSTSGNGGGANPLYAITRRKERENSPDVVTGMIKVFYF